MVKQRTIRKAVLITGWMVITSLCQCTEPQPDQPDIAAGQSGYALDTKTGCKVWDIDPRPNDSVTWSGGCEGGFATGFGVQIWYENGIFIERDEGTLIKGKQDGKITTSNGDGNELFTYWKNGVLTGKATYKNANGDVIYGDFVDGHFNGLGVETYANGDKYVGPFTDDNANGKWTETLSNGDEYVGEFRDGEFGGKGTETYPSGDRYIGEFSNGLPNGFGTYTMVNGERYEGDFKDGIFTGFGTYTYSNGDKYVGEFQNNARTGHGTLYSARGTILNSGIWQNGDFVKPYPDSGVVESNAASNHASDQDEIPLVSENGILEIPVNINGAVTRNFIIDSGASDVTIPRDVVEIMLQNGTLSPGDFLGTAVYMLADGSTVPSQNFRIRSLKVGDRVFENIVGGVEPVNAPPLLGQSFLSRFKSWSINNDKHALELQN